MSTKRLTRIAVLTAVALIVFMVENAFPPLLTFAPGVKIGLANAVVLTAVLLLGIPDALVVLIGKCFLGALFSGNVASLLYSLPSGLLSFAVMAALTLALPRIGVIGIGIAGAVVFNAVQLSVACLITGVNMVGLLPVMAAASLLTGGVVGAVAFLSARFLPAKIYT